MPYRPPLHGADPDGAAAAVPLGSTEKDRDTRPGLTPKERMATMAKDKKAGKPAKGDEFAKPSEAPSTGGDGWKFETDDNVGSLFLITPLRTQTVATEKYGDAEVVVCDIVGINEKKPARSELHEEVFVFGSWTKGALRGYIGERKVLGRLGQDAFKSKSKTPAWVLEDADDDDIEAARAYLAEVDPFVQTGKGKGK